MLSSDHDATGFASFTHADAEELLDWARRSLPLWQAGTARVDAADARSVDD